MASGSDRGQEQLDIAIVGGGISGVYAGWRLKQANPSKKIVLFEGSDHIGGRLLSVRPPGIPNMVAELGGMRILPEVQPRIAGLLDEINRAVKPDARIELYDFPVDEPQNLAYLRGTYLRLADFKSRPDAVPYHLTFLERGKTPGAIIVNAIEQIVPGITNDKLTDDERRMMVREANFGGVPLYRQGFWNVLMRVISGEAYQFGVDAGGYETTLSNWNCADAIPWYLADFGVAPKYKGFKKGFQVVPLAVADLFRASGGDIRLQTTLDGFDRDTDGFTLRFGKRTVRASRLILAMPRRSLELIAPSSPPLQEMADDIRSVTPRPLFKVFTTYTSPWWRAAGLQSGRTLTDLPVRQTYYWPTNEGQPAVAGPAMLMASYDDGGNIGFWDGLRPRRRVSWQAGREVPALANPFVGADDADADSDWRRYRAPSAMVAEIARQLRQIHGLSHTPDVRNASFRDWGDDPFGGGWNSWNIGVKSWEVKERMVNPADRLYVCGEAYSDGQGWVEGALQTADMMLEKLSSGA